MILAVLLACIAGIAAARTVVAETEAHRRGLPDRWWDPTCDTCGSPLGFTMVRCRHNGHRQRRMAFLVLVFLAIACGLLPLVVPTLWVVPAYIIFVGGGVALTVTDLDTQLIPNRILARLVVVGGFLLIAGGLADSQPGSVLRAAAAAFAYFGIMFVLALVARGALGYGDVKLAFFLGLFVGYLGWASVTVAVLGGFLIGGVVSLVLLLGRMAGRKDAIPFGPFMVAGAFVALYLGDQIIGWYNG